ncbi:MAG: DNA-deoxyinosine glycosylase [Planctomycetes bacterium]|nr:DNA-deoxyinosine glycosylase [Planctomycetota bacterium]
MPTVSSFPPIAAPRARVLIVGSMPGEASLRAGRYYAHPHNAFWPVVGAFCGFAPDLPYAARTARLRAAGIALWDVLQSCERDGSLDASIVAASERPNDFAGFLAAQPRIRAVLCNGGKAFAAFRRAVLPGLGARATDLEVLRLPSTSPAHASRSRAAKQRLWHAALLRCLGG